MKKFTFENGKIFNKVGMIKQDVTQQYTLLDNFGKQLQPFDHTDKINLIQSGTIALIENEVRRENSKTYMALFKMSSRKWPIHFPHNSTTTRIAEILLPDLYFLIDFKVTNKLIELVDISLGLSPHSMSEGRNYNKLQTLKMYPFTNLFDNYFNFHERNKYTLKNEDILNLRYRRFCMGSALNRSINLDNLEYYIYTFLTSRNNYDITPPFIRNINTYDEWPDTPATIKFLQTNGREQDSTPKSFVNDVNEILGRSSYASDSVKFNLSILHAISQFEDVNLIKKYIC